MRTDTQTPEQVAEAFGQAHEPCGLTKAQHLRLLGKLEKARYDRDKYKQELKVLSPYLVEALTNWRVNAEERNHSSTRRQLGDLQYKYDMLAAAVVEKAVSGQS